MTSNNKEFSGNYDNTSCKYNNLGSYNDNSIRPNVNTGYYVVPSWGSIGYNALTHDNQGSCGGYFNIQSAYGYGSSNCNSPYTNMLCGSCVGKGLGWKCDQSSKQCIQNGHLGTRGTFGNKNECEQNCKQSNYWGCVPSKLVGGKPSCKSIDSKDARHFNGKLYRHSDDCSSNCKPLN